MVNQDFLSSSKKWDWETPRNDFDKINEVFQFKIDVAATNDNAKCSLCITPEMDAFKIDWSPSPWFLNPPWGNEYTKSTGLDLMNWGIKIKEQVSKGNEGVLLCGARTDTKWWQYCAGFSNYILFSNRRIAFEDKTRGKPSQPTFPSCYIIYMNHLNELQINGLRNTGVLVKNY